MEGQVRQSAFEDLLPTFLEIEDVEVVLVVCEDYKLFRKKATKQVGSKFVASQIIGALKLWTKQQGIKLIMQDPDKKDLGEKYSGRKPPSNHALSHKVDAYNHGAYRLTLMDSYERQGHWL